METCIVAGAGPGLGTALAKRFSRGGFAVAAIARTQASVDAAIAAVHDIGGTARGYVCDAGDASAFEATLARIATEMAAPSVGIYNVANLATSAPTQRSADELVAEFRTNVAGAHFMTRALVPAMRASGRGTLLFTGGGLAIHPSAEYAMLSLGKAALRSLALSYGEELEPAGIHAATVTIYGHIQPGSRFDPASIAERYWTVHVQPRGTWTREEAFR